MTTTPNSVRVVRYEPIVNQLLERVPIGSSMKMIKSWVQPTYRPWEISSTISSHIVGLVQPYIRLAFANERRLRWCKGSFSSPTIDAYQSSSAERSQIVAMDFEHSRTWYCRSCMISISLSKAG